MTDWPFGTSSLPYVPAEFDLTREAQKHSPMKASAVGSPYGTLRNVRWMLFKVHRGRITHVDRSGARAGLQPYGTVRRMGR